MRKPLLFILLTGAAISTAHAGLSRLDALSMIETADNDAAVGGAGEVSRYQIKPWIWHRYSDTEAYRNRRISAEVAEQHLAELERGFRKRTGRAASDFDVYVLWNAGPTYYARIGFSKARVHPVIRERAQRYANLRERRDLEPALAASSQPKPAIAAAVAATPVMPSGKIMSAEKSAVFATNREPFWLVFPAAESAGLQSSLFSNIPLTTRPTASPVIDQPILAIGGLTAQGR